MSTEDELEKAARTARWAARTLKATNRLSNMMVQEVSLVDRAANKRTFLVAKNEGDDGGDE